METVACSYDLRTRPDGGGGTDFPPTAPGSLPKGGKRSATALEEALVGNSGIGAKKRIFWGLTAACLFSSTAAWPCAAVPPWSRSEFGPHDEDAVIVWDKERHEEHFVRNAVFDTNAPSFGFLVPVPATPTLAEASDKVFDALEEAVPPRESGVGAMECGGNDRRFEWGTLVMLGLGGHRLGGLERVEQRRRCEGARGDSCRGDGCRRPRRER